MCSSFICDFWLLNIKCLQNIKLYHFVRTTLSIPLCPIPFCPYTILSIPLCPIPFCPYTILSIPFCPYHFVLYHFVRSTLREVGGNYDEVVTLQSLINKDVMNKGRSRVIDTDGQAYSKAHSLGIENHRSDAISLTQPLFQSSRFVMFK